MGPRSCERGNGLQPDPNKPRMPLLQWGRARASAEMHRAGQAFWRESLGFNGAALVRARKWGRRRAPPLPPRRFNGAALVRARKYGWRSGGKDCQGTGFNGAALVRARKWGRRRAPPLPPRRFNGAALVRARKYGWRSGGKDCQGTGFNGAALVRARKWVATGCDLLQVGEASMGPRSCERGNMRKSWSCGGGSPSFNGAALVRARKFDVSEMGVTLVHGRFNGAALVRARKCVRPERLPRRLVASMGPRSCERGNASPVRERLFRVQRLQWGRARASAEMARAIAREGRIRSRFNGAALVRARKCLSVCEQRPWWLGFNGAALVRARKCAAS